MKNMRNYSMGVLGWFGVWLLAFILLVLPGCASLQNAGTASYSVKPFVTDQGAVHCCEVTVNNGKEIGLLDATVIKHGDDYEVRLHEEGAVAFEGQRIAAGGAVLIAPIAAPAIGAMLAAPGLGAAAVGAGALAAGQQLAK